MWQRNRQKGVVLAVTLFMLALLTIIGVSAVTLSTTHFRLVGNLQSANEAEMAMRFAIESFISEKNTDGILKSFECGKCVNYPVCTNDHQVDIKITPKCMGKIPPNSESSLTKKQPMDGLWDIEAKLSDSSTGTVHWGLITPKEPCEADNIVCPRVNCPAPSVTLTCNTQ